MSSPKIELPAEFPFTTELKIRITDINYGGHLGNDSVLSLIHEARVQYLASHGYQEKDVGGNGMLVTSAVILYKAQGFHGDRVVVKVAPRAFSRIGCELVYLLMLEDKATELARATTAITMYDYTTNKVVRSPPSFREALTRMARA